MPMANDVFSDMAMFRVKTTAYVAKVTTEEARARWVDELFTESQSQLRAEFLTMGNADTRFVVLTPDADGDLAIHHLYPAFDNIPFDTVESMVRHFHDTSNGFAMYALSSATVVLQEEDAHDLIGRVSAAENPNRKHVLCVQLLEAMPTTLGRLAYAEISTGADGKPTVGEWIERKRRNIAEA